MLHLLDANVLITAKDSYYPVDAVPEFWEWLEYMGSCGHVKIPLEIFEEIKKGPKQPERDLLSDWIAQAHVRGALLLDEVVDLALVQRAVNEGYAPDLTDAEVDELGRDPFLVAYGLADPARRRIFTAEAPKPGKRRQNRRVPDVCSGLGVSWCGPFEFYRQLGFSTRWKASLG